jgi:hypothetical protein
VRHFFLTLTLLISGTASLWGFSPQLSTVIPRGWQRGTEVEMHFHGERLTDTQEVLCYQPGVTFRDFKVIDAKHITAIATIAADAPLGEHQFRLRGPGGISEMRLFLVGQFRCIDEVEPNNQFDQPQRVELNTTVHGVAKLEDEDYFVCHLKKGQRLTAEVEAIRLGQEMFDAYVAILDPQRFELSARDDSPLLRTDCYASIVAPADGDYRIVVREAAYEGNDNCRYRLHICGAPRPAVIYPPGGKPGETIEFTFIGDPSGAIKQSITLPAAGPNPFPVFAQSEGLSAPSPNWIALSPIDYANEVEPNSNSKESTHLPAIPCAAHGIIGENGDTDWFRFEAKKNEALVIKARALGLRSPLDSVLSIRDTTGKNLTTNDDQGNLDSTIAWTCPADGEYFLRIQDKLRKGREDFTYRIEITRKSATIAAALPTVERVQTQKWKMLTVPRGNRYASVVNFTRENVGCALQLYADSLPAGMTLTAPPVHKNATSFPIIIEATADAPIAGGLYRIGLKPTGEGAPENLLGALNERIEHVDINNQGSYHGTSVDRISMAVTEEAPLRIDLEQPAIPIVKNGILPLRIKATRQAGYNDAVKLRFLWIPPGIGAPVTIDLAKGTNEAIYEINASADAATGQWPIVILAEATTPKGPVLVSSQFATLTVAEPFLTMNIELCATEQNKPTGLLAKLDVTTPFEGNATAELMGLPHGTKAAPMTFTKDTKELLFQVSVAADATIGKHQNLFCKVLIPQNGQQIVHQVAYGGVLRIDAPTVAAAPKPAAAPAAEAKPAPAAPAAAPAAKPLSRLEQLRQKQQSN